MHVYIIRFCSVACLLKKRSDATKMVGLTTIPVNSWTQPSSKQPAPVIEELVPVA